MTDEMTNEDLKELAYGLLSGGVFTDRHVSRPHELGMVFMPLVFMDDDQRDALADKLGESGMIYQWVREAGPRSVNGMPMFHSLRVLTSEEVARLMEIVEELEGSTA